jgi:CrcB protein
MLRAFLLVGLGGALGSMARYGVHMLVSNRPEIRFPFATLFVNLLGCFIIGCLFGYAEKNAWFHSNYMLVLATGFCGGFTTFSAFALDNNSLLSRHMPLTAFIYIVFSVVAGIALCRVGMWLVRW